MPRPTKLSVKNRLIALLIRTYSLPIQTEYTLTKETAAISGSFFLYPICKINELINYDDQHKFSAEELPDLMTLGITAVKYVVNRNSSIYFAPIGTAKPGVPSLSEMALQSYRTNYSSEFNSYMQCAQVLDTGIVFLNNRGKITTIVTDYSVESTIHLIVALAGFEKLDDSINIYSHDKPCYQLNSNDIRKLLYKSIQSRSTSLTLHQINLHNAQSQDKLFVLRTFVKPMALLKLAPTFKPSSEKPLSAKFAVTSSSGSVKSPVLGISNATQTLKQNRLIGSPDVAPSAKRCISHAG